MSEYTMVNLIGAPGTSKRQRWTIGSSATTTTTSRSPTPSASPQIAGALTLDRHFAAAGFRIVPA